MSVEGKGAIVTGAASGIGRAAAALLARGGARVLLADRDVVAVTAAAAAIVDEAGVAFAREVDVSDEASVAAMVAFAVEAVGRVDVLVNAAGVLAHGSVVDTEPEEFRRVVDVNLTGTYLCSRAVLLAFLNAGGGSIVNLSSSTGAHDAIQGAAAYVASKGGVTLLTRAMAIDHAARGIRVNAVAPGPTATPIIKSALSSEELEAFAATLPVARLGEPEEIAEVIVFLASDAASFVNGAIFAVDGGQTAAV